MGIDGIARSFGCPALLGAALLLSSCGGTGASNPQAAGVDTSASPSLSPSPAAILPTPTVAPPTTTAEPPTPEPQAAPPPPPTQPPPPAPAPAPNPLKRVPSAYWIDFRGSIAYVFHPDVTCTVRESYLSGVPLEIDCRAGTAGWG